MFQNYALFPHMTVLQNITMAPIWVRRRPKAEADRLGMEVTYFAGSTRDAILSRQIDEQV